MGFNISMRPGPMAMYSTRYGSEGISHIVKNCWMSVAEALCPGFCRSDLCFKMIAIEASPQVSPVRITLQCPHHAHHILERGEPMGFIMQLYHWGNGPWNKQVLLLPGPDVSPENNQGMIRQQHPASLSTCHSSSSH